MDFKLPILCLQTSGFSTKANSWFSETTHWIHSKVFFASLDISIVWLLAVSDSNWPSYCTASAEVPIDIQRLLDTVFIVAASTDSASDHSGWQSLQTNFCFVLVDCCSFIILPKKFLVVLKLLPPFLQYSTYSKPTQVVPITMAYQPNTNSDFLSPPPDSDSQTSNMIIDNTPFTTVSNKKEKRSTGSAANTILLFFQHRLPPSPPITIATATGTNHPEAPPTKKHISSASPSPIPDPLSGPTPPPNLIFTSTWLHIDICMPATDVKHSPNNILLTFHNFTSAAWFINSSLSFLPIFPTSKYPPLTQSMAISTSVHTLKHYLKNSTIASLLKQDPHNNTFWVRLLTNSSISTSFLIQQIRSIYPAWQIIIDPYDGMLPTPCRWLLFSSSSFIQRVALAKQLQTIFQASSDIDTPFQCIWTNIYGIDGYRHSTSPAIQIKCHPVHKQAIQTLFMELISPSAIDKQDPQ